MIYAYGLGLITRCLCLFLGVKTSRLNNELSQSVDLYRTSWSPKCINITL